jgi:hypothetical protein
MQTVAKSKLFRLRQNIPPTSEARTTKTGIQGGTSPSLGQRDVSFQRPLRTRIFRSCVLEKINLWPVLSRCEDIGYTLGS